MNEPNEYYKSSLSDAKELKEFAETLYNRGNLTNTALFYNTLKNDNDSVARWRKLGFLEGLDDTKAQCTARLFDEAAQHIINNRYHFFYFNCVINWGTLIFPIVRRIVSKSDDNGAILDKIGMDGLEKLFIEFIVRYKDIDWEAIAKSGVDVIPETLESFCRFGDAKQTEWFADWDFMVEAEKMIGED